MQTTWIYCEFATFKFSDRGRRAFRLPSWLLSRAHCTIRYSEYCTITTVKAAAKWDVGLLIAFEIVEEDKRLFIYYPKSGRQGCTYQFNFRPISGVPRKGLDIFHDACRYTACYQRAGGSGQ